ncbi:MAG: archease [Acidobacteriota bacterium]|nr:archease [Acidobacteriota bacterium]
MKEAPWYQLLDHTGDIAILVRAPTQEELYSAATRALFDVIADVVRVEPRRAVPIEVVGAVDREDLLVRYLSELLFLHDARGWLFRDAEIRRLTDDAVEADAMGEPFDARRHVIERQVKAVTYHNLLLSEDRDGWSARLVLDL